MLEIADDPTIDDDATLIEFFRNHGRITVRRGHLFGDTPEAAAAAQQVSSELRATAFESGPLGPSTGNSPR